MIYIIQNHADVSSGIFGELLQKARIPFKTIRADLGESLPAATAATAVILLGGYMGVHDTEEYPFLVHLKEFVRSCVRENIPFFGICLGGQLLAEAVGGEVFARQCGEKGVCEMTLTEAGRKDPLFAGILPVISAFQWHDDCFIPPPTAVLLASSENCQGQAFRCGRAWGVQFHPEVDLDIIRIWVATSGHSPRYLLDFSRAEIDLRRFGSQLLGNFLQEAGFS